MSQIPTGGRAQAGGLSLGEFVKLGDRVVLVDMLTMARYDSERVNIVQGVFGGRFDGTEALPRPTVYADDGTRTVVRQGDRVLISYLRDRLEAPVVLGVIRTVNGPDFLRKSHAEADYEGGQRVRVRLEPRDTQNVMTGRLDVRACDDGTGALDIRGTGRIVLRVGTDTEEDPATEGAYTQIEIEGTTVTVTADKVRLAGTQTLALAEAVKDALGQIVDAFSVPPVVPSDGGAAMAAAIYADLNLARVTWDSAIPTSKVEGA